MKTYDIVIIGSGPGGYISAIKASQLGFKVAIIEKYSNLGGTCLNVGCIPSKTMLESSEYFFQAKNKFYNHGIQFDNLKINFNQLIQRKNKIINQISNGLKYLINKNKIDVYYGIATFQDKNHLLIYNKINNSKEKLNFKNAIIATGSKPRNIENIQIDKKRIISSTEILSLNNIPKKLIIVGGGVIGLELGSVYRKLGSEVHIIEAENRIIPMMDIDISHELENILKKIGINFHLSTKIINSNINNNEVIIKLKNKDFFSIKADYCLITIGRSPFTKNLGLENIGIEIDKNGFIIVDKNLRTNIKNIFAIGDVIGGHMLAHKAADQGIYVIEIISGQKPIINYNTIPLVIYTSPEVASVGKTEIQLKENNILYKKGFFPMKALGKAIISDNIHGFVKILSNYHTDEILGVHIIGDRATDIIMEAVIIMEFHGTSEDITRICHPHPTFIESIKESAMSAFYNKSLHYL